MQLQHRLLMLWDHYQLMTQLLLMLRENSKQMQAVLQRYKEVVCSQSLEFVSEAVGTPQGT